jgi:hypothetical protein
VIQDRCFEEQQITACWTTERDAWNRILSDMVVIALEEVTALQGDAFAQRLRAAQDSWELTRSLDCELALTLPFAGDGGDAKCNAQYAAKRIKFLQDVISGAEFQG